MAIPKQAALELYEKTYLIRASEEAIRKEYSGNEMKTPVHLCNGSEAIAVGVLCALPPKTKVFGTYRNHGLYLALTQDTDSFFGELFGRETGCAYGLAGSMHLTAPEKGLCLTSAVVGTTIPVAVGAAFANKYKRSNDLVAVFFGDGGMEEGVFWESLNFACLHELRILFICENNDLAIHTLGKDRRGFKSIDEAVKGFKVHSAGGNGYLPSEVLSSTQEILEKMKNDPKPAFLRFDYLRLLEHVGVNEDFTAGYRQKPDEAALKQMDPLLRAEADVLKLGGSTDELKKIKDGIDQKIQASIAKARKAPFPRINTLHDYVFA